MCVHDPLATRFTVFNLRNRESTSQNVSVLSSARGPRARRMLRSSSAVPMTVIADAVTELRDARHQTSTLDATMPLAMMDAGDVDAGWDSSRRLDLRLRGTTLCLSLGRHSHSFRSHEGKNSIAAIEACTRGNELRSVVETIRRLCDPTQKRPTSDRIIPSLFRQSANSCGLQALTSGWRAVLAQRGPRRRQGRVYCAPRFDAFLNGHR